MTGSCGGPHCRGRHNPLRQGVHLEPLYHPALDPCHRTYKGGSALAGGGLLELVGKKEPRLGGPFGDQPDDRGSPAGKSHLDDDDTRAEQRGIGASGQDDGEVQHEDGRPTIRHDPCNSGLRCAQSVDADKGKHLDDQTGGYCEPVLTNLGKEEQHGGLSDIHAAGSG